MPTNSAGTTDGVARGPLVLREEDLVGVLRRHAEVHDYGDVTLPDPSPVRDARSHVIDQDGLGALVARVRDAVAPILHNGHFPLVIGGDCPLLLGCLAAATGPRIGLLFVDGHEDAYLPVQSSTGEAADMELAFALGLADASWSPELATLLPLVASTDIQILGARDAELLSTEGVESLRDKVALADGERLAADPARIAAAACASLPDPWWFHLDLDVLSTEALPAIDYPQSGGLGWDELVAVATQALSADPRGWDITIYNPDLDPERVHARRIVRFIGSVIGQVSSLQPV